MKRIYTLMLALCAWSSSVLADIPPPPPPPAIVQPAPPFAAINSPDGSSIKWFNNNGIMQVHHTDTRGYTQVRNSNLYPRATQFGNTTKPNGTNGNIYGTKSHPTTFTDAHGNTAKGTINTQTNVGTTSSIAKAGAVYLGATAIATAGQTHG